MIDHIVVRKQILVLKINTFLTDKDRLNTLRDDVMEQMKTGIVFLPSWVEAFTVDADEVKVVVKEEQK